MDKIKKLPHDISEILPYKFYLADWKYHIFVAIITLIFILIAVVIWRKKRVKKQPASYIIPPDPIETINKKLHSLSPQQPFSKKDQVNYYYTLSLLLRKFIELKFSIPATDSTFKELQKHMDTIPTHKTHIELKTMMLKFFKFADQIKFSEGKTTSEDALKDKNKVIDWIKSMSSPTGE